MAFSSILEFFTITSLFLYKEDYFKSIEFYEEISSFFSHAEVLSKVLFPRSHIGVLVELERLNSILPQELSRIGLCSLISVIQ